MKYTIVINQKRAVELNLNLQEVILINCIHDLIPVPSFEKNDKHMVWISYDTFSNEYPLLGIKDRTTFFRRFKTLIDNGFVTLETKRIGNKTKNYYGLTDKAMQLYCDTPIKVEKNDTQEPKKIVKKELTQEEITLLNKINELSNSKYRTLTKEAKKQLNEKGLKRCIDVLINMKIDDFWKNKINNISPFYENNFAKFDYEVKEVKTKGGRRYL